MYEFLDYVVQDVMTGSPITVPSTAPLAEAEKIFGEHDFNGLPVVDSGELVGILTKLDVLKAFRFTDDYMFPPYDDIMKQPVGSFMTRDLRTVRPRTPLTRVLRKMLDSGSKSLPVVDEDQLVGMVSRGDVLRALERATTPAD